MRNGTYKAISYSLLIHLLIVFILLFTQASDKVVLKNKNKKPSIKSFLYHAPIVVKTIEKEQTKPSIKKPPIKTNIAKKVLEPVKKQKKAKPVAVNENKAISEQKTATPPSSFNRKKAPPPPETPKPKLDSYTQLQRLRSRLNSSSALPTDNPYQPNQSPSVFNTNAKAVPHSVPLKNEEKEREKNTQNMGAGIAITKSEDGTCSVSQDMSVYGLSEGSSTQYFNCGESKFDKNFREHMKKVKTKLGK